MRPKRKKPELVAAENIRGDKDPDGFTKDLIPPKGRGVRTTIDRVKGQFLLNYNGELITGEEGLRREASAEWISVFRYFFPFKGKEWCIDSTMEVESGHWLGRLVNHGTGKDQNCKMKCIEVNQKPYLCLFATKDIPAGKELLYDYGVLNLPWEDGSKANKGNACEFTPRNSNDIPIVVLDRLPRAVAEPLTVNKESACDRPTEDKHIYTTIDDHGPPHCIPTVPDRQPSAATQHLTENIENIDISTAVSSSEHANTMTDGPWTSHESNCYDTATVFPHEVSAAATEALTASKGNASGIPNNDITIVDDDGAPSVSNCSEVLTVVPDKHPTAATEDVNKESACDRPTEDKHIYTMIDDHGPPHCIPTVPDGQPSAATQYLTENKENIDISTAVSSSEHVNTMTDDPWTSHESNCYDTATVFPHAVSAAATEALTASKGNASDIPNNDITMVDDDGAPSVSNCSEVLTVVPDKRPTAATEDVNKESACDRPTEDKHIYTMIDDHGPPHCFPTVPDGQPSAATQHLTENKENIDISTAVSSSEHVKTMTDDPWTSHESNCYYTATVFPHAVSAAATEALTEPAVVDDSSSDESEVIPFIRHLSKLNVNIKDERIWKAHCLNEDEDGSDDNYDDDWKDPDYKPSDQESSDCENNECIITDQEVTVKQRSSKLATGERDWGRKHTCFVCNASVCDVPRHMSSMHSDNELVENVLSKPKGSKERRALWRVLVNRGSYAHNIKAKETGGELHVVRRPSKSVCADNYVACIHCFGYFQKKDLWRHTRNCSASFAKGKESIIQKSISHVSSIMTSSSTCAKSSKTLLEDFFSKLKLNDEVSIVVKNDTLLNIFAVSLIQEGKHHTEVSYTLRQLARLLMKMREMSKQDMHWLEALNCKNWELIVEAIRELTGFSYTEDGIEVEKPHICKKYGQALKGLIAVLEGYSLSLDDEEVLKRAQKVMLKFDKEWKKIAKHCEATAKRRKDDEVDLLPLTSDVVSLKKYCVAEILRICDEPASRENFVYLQKILLTRLVTFNARRGGEPGKLKISQWPAIKEDRAVQEEEIESLPMEEKLLAKRMKLGYIRGKGNKKLPILFPPETVSGIDQLIENRALYFSCKDNKYVFGRINKMSKRYLRGSDCLREVGLRAKSFNYITADYITATQMRKYLATMLQLLDMSEAELRWVTDHLGHSVDVHKRWYRMSNKAVEMTKVASVLVAAESGFLQKAHSVPFDKVSTVNKESACDRPTEDKHIYTTIDDHGPPHCIPTVPDGQPSAATQHLTENKENIDISTAVCSSEHVNTMTDDPWTSYESNCYDTATVFPHAVSAAATEALTASKGNASGIPNNDITMVDDDGAPSVSNCSEVLTVVPDKRPTAATEDEPLRLRKRPVQRCGVDEDSSDSGQNSGSMPSYRGYQSKDPTQMAPVYYPNSRDRLQLEPKRDARERELEMREDLTAENKQEPPGASRLFSLWVAIKRFFGFPGIYRPTSTASDLMAREGEELKRLDDDLFERSLNLSKIRLDDDETQKRQTDSKFDKRYDVFFKGIPLLLSKTQLGDDESQKRQKDSEFDKTSELKRMSRNLPKFSSSDSSDNEEDDYLFEDIPFLPPKTQLGDDESQKRQKDSEFDKTCQNPKSRPKYLGYPFKDPTHMAAVYHPNSRERLELEPKRDARERELEMREELVAENEQEAPGLDLFRPHLDLHWLKAKRTASDSQREGIERLAELKMMSRNLPKFSLSDSSDNKEDDDLFESSLYLSKIRLDDDETQKRQKDSEFDKPSFMFRMKRHDEHRSFQVQPEYVTEEDDENGQVETYMESLKTLPVDDETYERQRKHKFSKTSTVPVLKKMSTVRPLSLSKFPNTTGVRFSQAETKLMLDNRPKFSSSDSCGTTEGRYTEDVLESEELTQGSSLYKINSAHSESEEQPEIVNGAVKQAQEYKVGFKPVQQYSVRATTDIQRPFVPQLLGFFSFVLLVCVYLIYLIYFATSINRL